MGRFASAAAIAAGALGLVGVSHSTEITASSWFPDTHPLSGAGYVEWAKTVEEASGGDLTIRVFTGEALLPPVAHLSGLSDGIAQLTYHAGTYTPSDLPEDNVLATLGIGLTGNIAVGAAVSDFYMHDPAMKGMFDRHGIVFLGGYATPPYIPMCRTKVETLQDIQGKKIRMPGAIHAEWAKEVGAVPVNVPSSEMFTGLEKGQLDCAANAANDLKSRSLWDVAKHVTTLDLGSYFSGWLYAMNADAWRNLTDEQRRVLLDTIPDGIIEASIAYTETSAEALAEAPEHGVTLYEPGAELQGALDDFKSAKVREFAIKEGTERFSITDSEGLVTRFEQTLEKWRGLLAGVDPNDKEALKAVLQENLYSTVDEAEYGAS